MPLRPMKGVGIYTERDAERERIMQEAHMHWAQVDAHIADALGEGSTIPVVDLEAE